MPPVRILRTMRLLLVASMLSCAVAAPLAAQAAPPTRTTVGLSTRASASMSLQPPRAPGDTANPRPLRVTIDYGVPHVRGRAGLPTELTSDGVIWRTGANTSTTFTTEADLVIGGADVPKGSYSLYTTREGGRYFLIINHNTGQWGTNYDATKDLVRVPLIARTYAEAQESLQYAWVPAEGPPARGVLAIRWATLGLTVEWSSK
jgi:streptogramin lyase